MARVGAIGAFVDVHTLDAIALKTSEACAREGARGIGASSIRATIVQSEVAFVDLGTRKPIAVITRRACTLEPAFIVGTDCVGVARVSVAFVDVGTRRAVSRVSFRANASEGISFFHTLCDLVADATGCILTSRSESDAVLGLTIGVWGAEVIEAGGSWRAAVGACIGTDLHVTKSHTLATQALRGFQTGSSNFELLGCTEVVFTDVG
jgi:hypothetical protein